MICALWLWPTITFFHQHLITDWIKYCKFLIALQEDKNSRNLRGRKRVHVYPNRSRKNIIFWCLKIFSSNGLLCSWQRLVTMKLNLRLECTYTTGISGKDCLAMKWVEFTESRFFEANREKNRIFFVLWLESYTALLQSWSLRYDVLFGVFWNDLDFFVHFSWSNGLNAFGIGSC